MQEKDKRRQLSAAPLYAACAVIKPHSLPFVTRFEFVDGTLARSILAAYYPVRLSMVLLGFKDVKLFTGHHKTVVTD